MSAANSTKKQLSKLDLIFRILKLLAIFTTASFWLYYLVTQLPKDEQNNSNNSIHFPTSFDELHHLSETLTNYNRSHFPLVFLLFCSAYLYKQAFAIPGSVFLNILAGVLYGPIYGTLLTSFFSGIGATCCYLFSKHIFGVIINSYFTTSVEKIRNKITIAEQNGSLFNVLLSLRFFPCSPNWLMNMSAPLCGVPINLFFVSVSLGLVPYNFICAQAGSVVSNITSVGDLLTFKVMASMVVMASVAMVPAWLKNKSDKVQYSKIQQEQK